MADHAQHSIPDGEADTSPALVQPISGMPATSIASLGDFSPGALISPQPLADSSGASGSLSLADTLEQTLAGDGRFAALLPQLVVTVDGGAVHLAGHVPSDAQKRSLLAVVRGVPGVANISDALTVG